jgi:hypothetical protein
MRLALDYKRRFLGETVEVLVEGGDPALPGVAEGFTERYLKARFPAEDPEALGNRISRIIIEKVHPEFMEGRLERD